MTVLHVDFETRSELDLREVGLHRYARHPSTDVWCCALAKGEAEPAVWTPHSKACFVPDLDGITVYAHNAPFELEIWNQIMVPRYGWPPLKPEQTFCTMAMCYAMGLPGNLEDAALALGLPLLKDAEGRALMLRMARPRSTKGGTVWWNEPEKLARLYAYCQQDVRVERELHKRLVPLSDTERRVWLLDYKINQQGAAVDVASVKGAIDVAEKVKQKGNEELAKVTGGAVQAVTAVAALKGWMEGQGVKVDSLAKQDVVDLLAAGGLPAPVERALFLRQEVGKASTAKLDKLIERVGEDGRIRQVYQYHGAATGRWAGRAVQLHNLPRDMPPAEAVERILEHVRKGEHEAIDLIYGPPITMISKCLRAFFVAPPGRRLISGDWSNVEGRGQAWFAGEEWKLEAFRKADAKQGPGIYELAYSRMFNVPVESIGNPSHERQIGKVSELAFGYQGGVGSFHVMAKTYGVKVPDAEADAFKTMWRAAHPKIVAVWKQIQRASINAVKNPGDVYTCGHPGRQAKFKMVGSFLWCLLPSGRAICYPYPRLLEGEFGPQLTYMTVPGPEDKKKGKIIYDPRNSNNWARISTYGGSLFNNIIQATCRDLLALCMLSLDEKGASIVLHTHDEIAIEVDQAKVPAATKAMEAEMKFVPSWAAGLPLHAACEANGRYGL